ncbi:MAG TPA: M56 family metallopeptidase [Steroidobacteraceae bacterium]|jgi:TonB family protein
MMLLLLESALRAAVIALFVWAALQVLRVRSVQVQRTAWLAVLALAMTMPLLMQFGARVPTEIRITPWIVALNESAPQAQATGLQWQTLSMWLVLAVASVLVARQTIGLVRWWTIRRAARSFDLAAYTGLDVRASDAVRAPATVFSTVLVPEDFERQPIEVQRAVIAHERKHVSNRDFYLQCLAQLHRSLFWFSPLAWWLPKQLSLLSEHISDDAAIAALEERTQYAEVLLSFATRAMPTDQIVSMAHNSSLGVRIDRILDERAPVRDSRMKAIWLATILLPAFALVAGFKSAAASGEIVLPGSNPALPLSQPSYPAVSRRMKEHGTVVLKLLVLEDGSVGDAIIQQSSGYPSLDYSAMYESYRWRLRPGTVDDEPARMWGRFAVTFKLSEEPHL